MIRCSPPSSSFPPPFPFGVRSALLLAFLLRTMSRSALADDGAHSSVPGLHATSGDVGEGGRFGTEVAESE